MFESEEQRAERRIAALRSALAAGDAIEADDRLALSRLGFLEFPRVITAHPGHRASGKLESLTVARDQFEMAVVELLGIVDEFHAFADTPDFHEPDGRIAFERIVARLRKELFTFSDLAHSVQDHCRRVQEVWAAPDFRGRLGEHFGADGLHEFVIALRTALHHLHVFDAEWELRWAESGERSSHFNLKRRELLEDHEGWGRGRPWLDAAPEKIDVRSLVSAYAARHRSFYDWYLGWAGTNLPAAVEEYRGIRLEHRRGLARMHWNFLLREFLKRGVDPMEHLHKFLTSEEVARARAMPPRSVELAEHAIACVDTTGGCTPELRAIGLALFGVPGAEWEPARPVGLVATAPD